VEGSGSEGTETCYIVQFKITKSELLIVTCGTLLAVAFFDSVHAWCYFKSEYKGCERASVR
jgi:hypothetical protein